MSRKQQSRITSKLRATAYHEAGHAVAKWAFVDDYIYADSLTIVPDSEAGTLGACRPICEDVDTEKEIRAYIVSLYAGAAAEWRVSTEVTSISEGVCSDDEAAYKYLHFIPDSEEELRDQARETIEFHGQVVERLALELLRYSTLDNDEVFFLLENEIEALENYRQFRSVAESADV